MRTPAKGEPRQWIDIKKASAPFTQSYQFLRRNLLFMPDVRESHSILVTSCERGEGKTTVAVNLALTLSGTGNRVLLVDADLRNPTVERYLNIDSGTYGLTSVLTGRQSPKDCMFTCKGSGLNVIFAGPAAESPCALLSSKGMEIFIRSAAARFDYVLFDSSPIADLPDASGPAAFVDGVLLVVRRHRTSLKTAARAKAHLSDIGSNVIGCVLNG